MAVRKRPAIFDDPDSTTDRVIGYVALFGHGPAGPDGMTAYVKRSRR